MHDDPTELHPSPATTAKTKTRTNTPTRFDGTGNQNLLTDAVLAVEAGVYGLGLGELPDGSGTPAGPNSHTPDTQHVPDQQPIFTLGRVQYAFPAPLSRLAVSNNIMIMLLSASSSPNKGPRLVRIDLDNPAQVEQVPLPPLQQGSGRNPHREANYNVFLDPSGTHVLVIHAPSASVYWWISGWKRARFLPQARKLGLNIWSIGWPTSTSLPAAGRATSSSTGTGTLLVGTRQGELWETRLAIPQEEPLDFLDRLTRRTAGVGAGGQGEAEVYWKRVLCLPSPEPVTGLHISCLSGSGKSAILATTPSRMYEFVGLVGTAATSCVPPKKKGAGFQDASSSLGAAPGNDDGGVSPHLSSSSKSSSPAQYERLFSAYRSTSDEEADAAKCLRSELPGAPARSSILRVFTPSSAPSQAQRRTEQGDERGKAPSLHFLADHPTGVQPAVGSTTQVAWLVLAGIYHALLTTPSPSSNGSNSVDQVLDQASLLPFPSGLRTPDPPLSMALTQYHTVILFPGGSTTPSSSTATPTKDGPKLVCQRTVDDATVFTAHLDELLQQPEERVLGVASDPIRHTVWIYTTASILELVIENEGRNVWRALLRRNRFSEAFVLAPTASAKQAVVAAQADRLLLGALGLAKPDQRQQQQQRTSSSSSSAFRRPTTALSLEEKRTLVHQAAEL